MNPNVDVITIGVTHLEPARRFYEGGFGLPVEADRGGAVEFALGSSRLELRRWDELAEEAGMPAGSSGFRGFTLSYIVEQAADVDDMLERLVSAGGAVAKRPRFAFWGYSAHVTDPSGHLWKIASPKRRPLLGGKPNGNGARKLPEAQELALTIGVADMKRAKQFYKDGLGNPTKKDYSKFVSFDGDEGTPDLAMYTWDALAKDADVPADGSGFRGYSMSHIVDSAEDVEKLLNAAARAGGSTVRPPFATSPGSQSAYFADPDGHLWKIATRT